MSNKTGSLPVVLSAKHICPSVKVLVLSDLEKVEGLDQDEISVQEENNDPKEVVSGWQSEGVKGVQVLKDGLNAGVKIDGNVSVEVKNVYFEWVPLSLVDALVCEEGVLDGDSIHEKSRQLGKKMDRYFGDL